MTDKAAKRIPYGIADYGRIIRQGYYYVDKTNYLEIIENAGSYIFFIRPRRFGKSLFLSMMEGYYDILRKNEFRELFNGTHAYQHPTPERHSYLVLKLNFSLIDPHVDKVETSFLYYIREKAEDFLTRYKTLLQLDNADLASDIEKINRMDSSSDILRSMIRRCKRSTQKLYVLIDEYDNFTNTLLSTSGTNAYHDLTHGEGFLKTFFNVLKGGTSDMDAPITRLFMTGVSPVTLDDITSGFNIGDNISLNPAFNSMLGFTTQEVNTIVDYYRTRGLIENETPELLALMNRWYGNYRFSVEAEEKLFNSDMVLYYFQAFLTGQKNPEELIDRNARMDYGKLRHLIIIDRKGKKEANGNFSKLRQLVEEGEASSKLAKGFPLDEMDAPQNFVSLLFYLGLLTIKGKKEGLTLLTIPNQTIRSLYYDYIIQVGGETGLISLNSGKINELLHGMAYHGNWEEFFLYIAERMAASTSLRDFIREEKVIQGFLLAWLGIADYFIVHSEREFGKGYADIFMEPFFSRYQGITYSYMLEIKYVKAGEKGNIAAKVERLKEEAEQQLKKYAADETLVRSIGKTQLIKLVLVFAGAELEYIGPVEE